MIEINLKYMLDRVSARKSAKECPFCQGRGKIVTPDSPGDISRYSQDCPNCGDAYKVPRKWSLMTDEDIIHLFSLSHSLQKKQQILTSFVQSGLLSEERYNGILKILK